MESFIMNTFLVRIFFILADKEIYVANCKNHKIWNHFIINQLINSSRTISEWELSATIKGAICATLCDPTTHPHVKTHEAQSIKHVQRFRLMWVGVLHRQKRPLGLLASKVMVWL